MHRRGNWDELRDSLYDAYINSISLITINIVWFMLMLPVITVFPALAGLYYATNHMAHDRTADWHTFFEGFRQNLWLSYRWGLMNLVAFVLLGSSVVFYAELQEPWAVLVRPVVMMFLIIWTLLQIYTFPLLLEQEDQRLITALRNSGVIWLKRPLFSLGTAVLLVLIAVISTILGPAWIFITGSLCAYLANRAVVGSIAQITGKSLDV